jgi:microcystin-dependent protein
MSVNLSPLGNGFNFLDVDGRPLNAGKLYTYQAGSTTPFATYTDVNGLIANTNPIILGTDGRPPSEIWLTDGFFYKFVLTDSSDVTIQTYDNLYGIIGTAPTPPTPTPAGVIVLWSGSIGSIPAGWVLCNGSNGTPDLRNRFVVGAGSTYAVDATGGSADAIVVSHTHTVSVSGTTSNRSLTGTITVGGDNQAPSGIVSLQASTGARPGLDNASGQQQRYAIDASHDHTVTASGTTASAGTSGTNANLPPYYALCYIMKT